MRVVSGIAVVAALAGFFAFVGATVLQTADALPGQVRPTLYTDPSVTPPESGGGLDLMHIHTEPTGAARGMQVVVFGALLGGLPVAVAGLALARYGRVRGKAWPGEWSPVFLGAFAFQLASLCLTSLLLLGLLLEGLFWSDPGSVSTMGAAVMGGLLVSILFSSAALRAWRGLVHAVSTAPVSVVS